MVAPTNFLQWNPNKNNQLSDGSYSSNTSRQDGAVIGIFDSPLANKMFYQCSTMAAALGAAMVNKGYEMQDDNLSFLISSLSNLLTKANFGTGAGTVCQGNDSRLLSSGMTAWFYQNVAPSGWTIVSGVSDVSLAVKGGSNAYNVSGGLQAGTWTQPSHTHSGGSHTHTVNAHNHQWFYYTPSGGSGINRFYDVNGNAFTWTREVKGLVSGYTLQYTNDRAITFNGYTTKDTTSTGTSDSGTTGASGTPNTYRPLSAVGIICRKD